MITTHASQVKLGNLRELSLTLAETFRPQPVYDFSKLENIVKFRNKLAVPAEIVTAFAHFSDSAS